MSAGLTREEFLAAASTGQRLLEIGPGVNPIFSGDSIEYLDVLDAEALRARMIEHGADPQHAPQHIHYVAPDGRLSIAPSDFEAVASSHNIEHHPDLIRHLQDVAERLLPGGAFLLIIPDKRYCFDHFIRESVLADVLGAWLEERRVHTPASLIEHRSMTTHNDPARHWAGDHGEPLGAAAALAATEEWRSSGGQYLDVHAWQFTPASFRLLIQQLVEVGLSPFDIDLVGDTPPGRFEFCARLVKRA